MKTSRGGCGGSAFVLAQGDDQRGRGQAVSGEFGTDRGSRAGQEGPQEVGRSHSDARLPRGGLREETLLTDLKITPERVANFYACKRATKLERGKAMSQRSIDKARSVLRLAVVWAAERGIISKAPPLRRPKGSDPTRRAGLSGGRSALGIALPHPTQQIMDIEEPLSRFLPRIRTDGRSGALPGSTEGTSGCFAHAFEAVDPAATVRTPTTRPWGGSSPPGGKARVATSANAGRASPGTFFRPAHVAGYSEGTRQADSGALCGSTSIATGRGAEPSCSRSLEAAGPKRGAVTLSSP